MSLEDSVSGRFAGREISLLAYFSFRWGSLGQVRVRTHGRLDVGRPMVAVLGLFLMDGRESVTLKLSSCVVKRVCLCDALVATGLISWQVVQSRGKFFIAVERQQRYARLS